MVTRFKISFPYYLILQSSYQVNLLDELKYRCAASEQVNSCSTKVEKGDSALRVF